MWRHSCGDVRFANVYPNVLEEKHVFISVCIIVIILCLYQHIYFFSVIFTQEVGEMKRKDGGMLQCQSSFIKINFYVLTEYIIKISFKTIIFSDKSRDPSPLTKPSHGENLQLLTTVLTNLNRDCRRLAPPLLKRIREY